MAIINTSKNTHKPKTVTKPRTTAHIPKQSPPPKVVPRKTTTTAYIPKPSTPTKTKTSPKVPTGKTADIYKDTHKSTPTSKPVSKAPAISSGTMAEIKRKAEAGIPMSNPTPEKLAAYNQYQAATKKTTSKPPTPTGKSNDIYSGIHKPSRPTPKAPAGKMAGIYDGLHKKPATTTKPSYPKSPSLKAPTGKMADIYKDMHKPVSTPSKPTSKPTSTYRPTSTYKPTTTKPSYPTATIPKTSTPVTPAKPVTPGTPTPVTSKPPQTSTPNKPSNPSQPGWGPSPYVPKVRDENGTVGPTDNGHNNWNSNQSITDYGAPQADMIKNIEAGYLNGGRQYDPATDPAYQAQLLLAKKQADAAGLSAMEDMNERGILNSTVTADRIGQIKQGASDAVIGNIPGMQSNYNAQQQANQAGYTNLLQLLMGGQLDQQEFAEGNRRYDKGYQLDEADVTGVYTPAEAIAKGYNVGAGIQTLKAQGQYADQALAKDKLTFEKDAFGQEIALKNRDMSFQEQNALIKADLESRGLDLEEVKLGIDKFAAESDADYKQRQISNDVTDYEAKTNTNKAIGQILSASSAAEGFAFINSNTNAWASSGVDFKSVLKALESKFPGSKDQLESASNGSGYSYETP